MAWNHALLSLSLLAMCIIMPVYWSIIHTGLIESHNGDQVKIFYSYYAHSMPAISVLYNCTVTDFLFSRSYVKFAMFLGTVFFTLNFIATKATGIVTYSFLTWADPFESAVVVTLFMGSGICLVYLLALVFETAKARRLPIIEKGEKCD